MKKILVFYSKTGGGHLRSAEAILEEIKKRDDLEVVSYDGLEQTSFNLKINPVLMYGVMTTTFLPIWNFFWRLCNNTFGTRVVRRVGKLIWGKNFKEIIKKEQPDLIISVHFLMTSETTGSSKGKIPFVFVVTDLGFPHRTLFDDRADIITTPDGVIKKLGEKFIKDKTKLRDLGYPVRSNFYPHKIKKLNYRLLVLGGGVGSGNLEKTVLYLINNIKDKKIVVVCGQNKNLYKKLTNLKKLNLEVYGFVEDIHKLMADAGIVITKSGPGSIMEAAVMGKPLIVTTSVGPQEKDNVSFVVENKLGLFCPDIKNLKDAINQIYRNYPVFTKGHIRFKSGTKTIVDEALKLLSSSNPDKN